VHGTGPQQHISKAARCGAGIQAAFADDAQLVERGQSPGKLPATAGDEIGLIALGRNSDSSVS